MDMTQKTKSNALGRAGKRTFTTKTMVAVSFLSTLSYVLMLLESPPFLGFLRLELSDIPAIIGGFQFGPLAAVIIELIKNLIKLITASKTAGVGELANFAVSIAYVVPAAYLYKKLSGKHKEWIGYGVGTVSMAIVGMIMNYFVMIPLYSKFAGGIDNIIALASTVPGIHDKFTLILYGITPFNIVKGIFMGIVAHFTYKLINKIN